MLNRRKEKALELQEKRTRRAEQEKAAGTLIERAPALATLSIAVHETRLKGSVSDTHHIRRVVVEHAAALFSFPCSDAYCQDGGYDVTREVLAALSQRKPTFEVEQDCRGRCGQLDCGRHLRIEGTATYRDELTPSP